MGVENVILCDFVPAEKWVFLESLKKSTKYDWKVLVLENNYKPRINRIIDYFVFPMNLVMKRCEIDHILSWQQFYGIIYAFYLRLLHVKKRNRLIIMTFIYKPKKGIVGKIYLAFMKYSANNKYVDNIICFSSHECDFYKKIFQRDFRWVSLGIEDRKKEFEDAGKQLSQGERYYLAVGRSNRDYDFLIKAFKKMPYNLKIICDVLNLKGNDNISVYNNIKGDDYYRLLAGCYAVIIPLKDENISSGQLSLLEAIMMAKPVICTSTHGIRDYLKDNKGCISIKNNYAELRKAIEELEVPEVYSSKCYEARKTYEASFTIERMADQIAKIIVECGTD